MKDVHRRAKVELSDIRKDGLKIAPLYPAAAMHMQMIQDAIEKIELMLQCL
jgi:hypothetical protein